MTDNEKFYDDEIAPALLDMATRCAARGISMIAVVEYNPATSEEIGDTGETVSLVAGSGFKMRMTEAAVKSHGNADALIMALMRYGKEHGHSSLCLHQLGVPLMPKEKSDGQVSGR